MRLILNSKYGSFAEWMRALPSNSEGRVIYSGRNEVRIAHLPDGTEVCIKRYRCPRIFNRIVYTLFRAPKAQRAYENALRLQKAGISTPEPVGYIILSRGGLIAESYLVALFCPYSRNFYEFRHHPLEGHEHIVKALAALAAKMHTQGILHKDFSPGNILFEDSDGDVQISLIDINRMSFSSEVSARQGCRNFARLWGKENFFRLLAHEYARCRGLDEKACERMTLHYWRKFWHHRK